MANRKKVATFGFENYSSKAPNPPLKAIEDIMPPEVSKIIICKNRSFNMFVTFSLHICILTFFQVLEKILENLGGRDKLVCRKVNKRWMEVITKVREASTLSSYSRWLPYQKLILVPTLTPKLVVADLQQSPNEVRCPQALETYLHDDEGRNPFPAKSLALCDTFVDVYPPFILFPEVNTKYGHHLTSLSLRSLEFQLEPFIEMLSHTQNLRALRMLNTFVHGISSSTSLPPLIRLETLLLYFNNYWTHGSTEEAGPTKEAEGLKKLLLDCYSTQLITFDTFFPSCDTIQPISAPFQNLEQLKIYPTSQRFLIELTPAPFLKRLALKFNDFRSRVSFIKIMGYIDQFASTLEHLYLDFPWSDVTKETWTRQAIIIGVEGELHGTHDYNDNDPLRNKLVGMNGKLPSSCVIFSKLTTLAISYPRENIDKALVVNTVLPKFPAMKYLRFLHFKSFFDDYWNPQLSPDLCQQFFLEQGYWRICADLKRITVTKWKNYENSDEVVAQVNR